MKRLLNLFRTTIVGGILFLVPLVVVVMVIEKALTLAHKVVDPLAKHLPVQSLIGLETPIFLSIALMVMFCFLAGFVARTSLARKMISGLESSVLSHLPGYEFLKGMGQSLLGVEDQAARPAVLVRFDDTWQMAFQIEVLENGLVGVFVPDVPDTRAGSFYFLTADRVTPVEVPPARVMKCLKRLGVGSGALVSDSNFSDRHPQQNS